MEYVLLLLIILITGFFFLNKQKDPVKIHKKEPSEIPRINRATRRKIGKMKRKYKL